MVSTIVGIGELTKAKKWRESQKQHVKIDCPEVISQYNSSMGCVDKFHFFNAFVSPESQNEEVASPCAITPHDVFHLQWLDKAHS